MELLQYQMAWSAGDTPAGTFFKIMHVAKKRSQKVSFLILLLKKKVCLKV